MARKKVSEEVVTKAPVVEEAPKAEVKETVTEKKTRTRKAAAKAEAPVAEAPVAEEPVKAKKAPAKRAAKKSAEVKAAVSVQFSGKEYTTEKLVEIAKDVWQYDLGRKPEDFQSVELYVKTEESAVYYVINGETAGSFAI
ncbi:MAG: DUF6465 family protein [Eubacteriales bacterium]|nr:DUF6465 family protein [Eubacteriales bacterium]